MRPFVLLLSSALFSAAHAQAQSEIRIGSASPLSGPGAHLGKDIENGARMAVDDLNAKGVTIGGRKVKWVLQAEDDGSDPKAGTAVAQKLVDAGVAAVVGHLNSGTTVPASKLYASAGIPQISPAATTPLYTQQGYKTAFRVVANDKLIGRALARQAIGTLKARKIAVIDDRTAFGERYRQRYGYPLQTYAPYAYDAVMVFAAAMQQAQSGAPAGFLPALAKIRHAGITGPIAFDGKGDLRDAALTLYTYRQGRKTKLQVLRAQ